LLTIAVSFLDKREVSDSPSCIGHFMLYYIYKKIVPAGLFSCMDPLCIFDGTINDSTFKKWTTQPAPLPEIN
jgi:hypothetical protein